MTLRSVAFVVLAVCVSVIEARASDGDFPLYPDCGTYSTFNDIWQQSTGSLTVQALGKTTRSVRPSCLAIVRVEIWVDGTFGGASDNDATYSAAVTITRYRPSYGLANSYSNHWWIWTLSQGWEPLGQEHDQVNVAPSGPTGGGSSSCTAPSLPDCDCGVDPSIPGCGSPILVDTDADGYKLTSVANGVLFDLDGDGEK